MALLDGRYAFKEFVKKAQLVGVGGVKKNTIVYSWALISQVTMMYLPSVSRTEVLGWKARVFLKARRTPLFVFIRSTG